MPRHRIVWQADRPRNVTIDGEGNLFTVTATPVVTSDSFGVSAGMYYHGPDSFGHWESSVSCDVVTAWRAAQLLSDLQTVKNGWGYDDSITGVVIALQGDRNQDRLRERAKDFGIEVDELIGKLGSALTRWPSSYTLSSMWERISFKQQEDFVPVLRKAAEAGRITVGPVLELYLQSAEDRIREAAERRAQAEKIIEDGPSPSASLRRFLEDIGVANLVYPFGADDMFAPSHFKWADLDREVMRELIGERGYASRVRLITSALQPDDPDAHHSEEGGSISVYWSNFGDSGHPRIQLGGEEVELIHAGWDSTQGQFSLTLRPVGLSERNDSQDESMTVAELRARIGMDLGLGRPLGVGETPAWARRSAPPPPRMNTWRRFGLGRRSTP